MIRTLLTATLLCLLAVCLSAADINGKWQAQVPGRDGNMMDTTFTFKLAGESVSGTIENQFGERQISDGKLAGDDLSFTVNIDANGNQLTFLYKGKVAGSEIKMSRERKGADGPAAKAEFVAKRKS